MAITPEDLLQYAESLILGGNEISARAAAGRAFYAAHHFCKPILKQIDPNPNTQEGTHHKIIRLFSNYYGGRNEDVSRKIRAIGAMYRQVREIRSRADYEIDSEFAKDDARLLVETAKRISSRISELRIAELGNS